MSAKDVFHEAVKRGLEKEQWHTSHEPARTRMEEVRVKIDLAAERLIAAERGEELNEEKRKLPLRSKALLASQPLVDLLLYKVD